MRLLLDTHGLVWWITDFARIPQRTRDLMRAPGNTVFVSAATAWEIATKMRLGKLAFDAAFLDGFDVSLRVLAFEPLAVTAAHAVAGARLHGAHKDPFDRLLVGQAICEGLTVITIDRALAALGAQVVW